MSKNRGLNLRLLLRITQRLLAELFPKCSHELGVHYVSRAKIAEINEKFLGHEGPTDVITFNYANGTMMHGEIFICPDEAVRHAKEFGTTPQLELVRYLVHGLLHLRGYDDRQPAKRAKMKRAEDKWMRWVTTRFPCDKVWSRKRAA